MFPAIQNGIAKLGIQLTGKYLARMHETLGLIPNIINEQ